MASAREIQKQVTRPTSVTVMVLLFQIFTKSFPDAMSQDWQDITLTGITVIGGYGLIEKAWKNRHEIKEFIVNIFKRKHDTP